ncbi:MAG: Rab family GTPase [Candidatus Kariarchaeaceae archaeon]|jgi:small GTP-binding protein
MSTEDASDLKIVLGGRWGVGKSSIRRHIISGGQDRFKHKYLPTIGSDFSFMETDIAGNRYRLLLWDLAGEERFRQFRSLYFQAASASLLIFDLTDRESFDILDSWVDDLQSQTPQGGVPVVLIGNKLDLILDDSEICVSTAEIDAAISRFEEKLNNQFKIPYLRTSAVTGQSIDNALETLVRKVELWRRQSESL